MNKILSRQTVLLIIFTTDLIWHNDEIPYDPASRCYRGHSYYTNHDTPNETDINFEEDQMTSLLDYKSKSNCFYCVCSVSGDEAGCISRSIWFCNYLRYLRTDKAARDMYAHMFQQDRPTYFRQLSWRMRRTMDNSLFNLIEHGMRLYHHCWFDLLIVLGNLLLKCDQFI